MACLLLAGVAPAQDAPSGGKKSPGLLDGLPAGLILIPEGEVVVGFTGDTLAKLIPEEWVKRMTVNKDLVGSLGGDKVRLPAFFISSHEVTNAQYETFVKATGHRFPYHWWTKEDRDKHADLFKEATPTEKFDPILYWEMNWENRKLEWSLPVARGGVSMAEHPVEWVSYRDALAYCKWAGLRMPTEVEWTRAARGDSDRVYPWGSDWDPKRAWHFHTYSKPVHEGLDGEVAWGAGKLFHLAGNVMEWTSSRYLPLPGYDREHGRLSKRLPEIMAETIPLWDGAKAVIKGGSYQLPATARISCMIDSRAGVDTDAPLISAGFRTCKSLWPGLDAFRVAVDMERASLGEKNVEVENEEETNYLGLEAWQFEEERIRSYHSIGFAPIAEHDNFSSAKELREESTEDPVLLGLLFTTEAIQEPELPPGFYLVYFRDDRPSRNVLNKIAELKEKQKLQKKAKQRGEEIEEPEEPMPDPNIFKLGNLELSVKFRYLIFRSAETGAWLPSLFQAEPIDQRPPGLRSVLRLNNQREQLFFEAPVRINRGRNTVPVKLRLTMPAGFLSSREWRLPNMLSKDTYGYRKGWQKQLLQVGTSGGGQGAPQPASVSTGR